MLRYPELTRDCSTITPATQAQHQCRRCCANAMYRGLKTCCIAARLSFVLPARVRKIRPQHEAAALPGHHFPAMPLASEWPADRPGAVKRKRAHVFQRKPLIGLPFTTANTGRSDRIRTYDPLIPNQMRYQAALRSGTGDSIVTPAPRSNVAWRCLHAPQVADAYPASGGIVFGLT
jgi:hypothetical protein